MEAFVDPNTVASHAGLNQCGTALLLEGVALFLERATLVRYLNLHHTCIAAVFPNNESGTESDTSFSEEYVGI
jgi:hypothetical protein